MKIINQIWCLIPARSGSKTIKNKNIYKIRGKELIKYSVEFANKSKLFDKIIFSSDSVKYFEIIKNLKNIEFHHRSKKISKDTSTDLEVFKDYLKFAKKNIIFFQNILHTLDLQHPLEVKNMSVKQLKKLKNAKNVQP